MRTVLHLLRKDLFHTRWLIGAWLLITLLDVGFRLAGTGLFTSDTTAEAWRGPEVWLMYLSFVITLLVVSWIVHEDPVGGWQGFWLTRPIARSVLYASKVTGLLLVLVLPGLLAVPAFLAAWGVGGLDLWHAVAETLFFSLVSLSMLFAAAALTRHLGEMLLLMAGGLGMVFVSGQVVTPFLLDWLLPDRPRTGLPIGGTAWNTTITFVSILFVLTIGTWWLYRTRNRTMALAVMLTLFVASASGPKVLRAAIPASARQTLTPVSEPWAASDRLAVRVLLDEWRSTELTNIDSDEKAPPRPRRSVAVPVPVVLDGLPPDYTATPTLSDIEWRVDGFTHREAASATVRAARRHDRYRPSLTPTVDRMTASMESAPTEQESWPTLLTISDEEYRRYRGRPGHYAATVRYIVRRHDLLRSQLLREGADVADGSRRMEILHVDEQRGCRVDMRRVDVEFVWPGAAQPVLGYRFEDASGRPLRVKNGRARYWSAFALLPFTPNASHIPLRVSYETKWLSRWDDDAPGAGAPRDGGENGSGVPLTCAEVRWTAVRTTQVGLITRRIEMPAFVLKP